MGPYRTPAPPETRVEPPPVRDREDLIVHGTIGVVGVIGATAGFVERDFHAGFALAVLLVVLGLRGILRPPES